MRTRLRGFEAASQHPSIVFAVEQSKKHETASLPSETRKPTLHLHTFPSNPKHCEHALHQAVPVLPRYLSARCILTVAVTG